MASNMALRGPVFDALFPDHRVFRPINQVVRTQYQAFNVPGHPQSGRAIIERDDYAQFSPRWHLDERSVHAAVSIERT